jgi:hypothetical protein
MIYAAFVVLRYGCENYFSMFEVHNLMKSKSENNLIKSGREWVEVPQIQHSLDVCSTIGLLSFNLILCTHRKQKLKNKNAAV